MKYKILLKSVSHTKKLFSCIIFFGFLIINNNALSDDEISLRDVEKYCKVNMYNARSGDVECDIRSLNKVTRRCEVYLNPGSKSGGISCRGSELREIERRCRFYLFTKKYGVINC